MFRKISFSWVLFYFGFIFPGSAQQNLKDQLTSEKDVERWFENTINPQYSFIINGPEYHTSFKGLKSHPFYKTAECEISFVVYNANNYRNVNILYDTYKDILILRCILPTGFVFIELDEKYVEQFDLHNHHFKKFDTGIAAGIGTYFDVLFEAKQFSIVVKRHKIQRIDTGTKDYLEDDVYYILNAGRWQWITGKRSFENIFKEKHHKDKLDQFLTTNRINVRAKNEADLARTGEFCYKLLTGKTQ